MVEFMQWRRFFATYGSPEAIETSRLLAELCSMVGSFLGGKTPDGKPLDASWFLPRFGAKKPRIPRAADGTMIPATDPLATSIRGSTRRTE